MKLDCSTLQGCHNLMENSRTADLSTYESSHWGLRCRRRKCRDQFLLPHALNGFLESCARKRRKVQVLRPRWLPCNRLGCWYPYGNLEKSSSSMLSLPGKRKMHISNHCTIWCKVWAWRSRANWHALALVKLCVRYLRVKVLTVAGKTQRCIQ